MSAVPTIYAALTQVPVNADITSLRHAMVGASPLPAAVRDGFQSHTGVALVEGYGLTEATCASARSFPAAPRRGSVGQRLPYQRVKAVREAADGTWEDLPAGQVGVLAIAGPTVFPGYIVGRGVVNRGVVDRGAGGHRLDGLGKLRDGWLDTGDLARVDADGFVFLAGRAKDLIIRGGHNIDPATVEDALLAHPQVTAAAAVGRPDPHAGEVPVAYVSLAPGATVAAPALAEFAAQRVAERAAAPKAVTVLDALPVTALGKPYKLPLRQHAVRGALVDAMAGFGAGVEVETRIEDGAVVATVTVPAGTDQAPITAVLNRYPVRWTLEVS